MLIGAPFEASNASGVNGDGSDNSLNNAGAAYLFAADENGDYLQTAYLKASNPESGTDNQFGNAVALSGNTLAIAAWREDGGSPGINGDQSDTSATASGAVYVFETDASEAWQQTAYVKASNPGPDHNFGAALAIDGDTLAIGAPGEPTGAVGSGAVYVFSREDAGTWRQDAMLKANVIGLNDGFGSQVVLVGDLLAIGAPGERSDATGINGSDSNENAVDSGATYLFERDSAGDWAQVAYVKASNTDTGDRFGSALALDGDTLSVAAPSEQSAATGIDGNQGDNTLNGAGAAYVLDYRRDLKMAGANTSVVLARRPSGAPSAEDFSLETSQLRPLEEGELLLKNHFVSLDAGFRNWMDEDSGDEVLPAMPLGAPVMGLVLGEVMDSRHPEFSPGTLLMARLAWQEYSITDAADFLIRLPEPLEAEPAAYLGLLGDTGLSAYFGLRDIGQPQPGETVLISAAAGAVGSIAGQIARIMGARAVGITSGAEKSQKLISELGYDAAVDRSADLATGISAACPNGVDVYFDNVGGPMLETVIDQLNEGGRIVLCGAVSTYGTEQPGPSNLFQLVTKQASMTGFLTHTRADEYPSARAQLAAWLQEGKISAPEYRLEGIESVAQAFCDLFAGRNFGKTIVAL